ncbi:Uncharacterised protein [Yersinia enterocolitica]|nr:Uncharacterised protein [Yersinia enterocolitica]CNF47440.1 Uncharacterised protein [Yersinia enterocolitica]CNG48769.1 Uncharacterised protein [Yersinia enterocolitica]CNJ56096.1 Uncharacterised protein [Yersinia enterocolitica]
MSNIFKAHLYMCFRLGVYCLQWLPLRYTAFLQIVPSFNASTTACTS